MATIRVGRGTIVRAGQRKLASSGGVALNRAGGDTRPTWSEASKRKRPPAGGLSATTLIYDVTPAPAWGVAAAAVAPAASFRILGWMGNIARSSRSETPNFS